MESNECVLQTFVLVFLIFINTAQAACTPDKDDCHYDGSLGYCCSGYCIQNHGQSKGYCQETENTNTNTARSCIPDGENCKSTGELGFCCSSNCFQLGGEEFGKCVTKSDTNTTTNVNKECIKDNQSCHRSGSLGNCCSGICFQSQGFDSGYCQKKSNSACLEDGEECHLAGTKGFCCSGMCNQTAEEIFGHCSYQNGTRKVKAKDNNAPSGLLYAIFGMLLMLAAFVAIIATVIYRNRLRKYVFTEEDIKEFLEGQQNKKGNVANGEICNTDSIPYDADSYEIDENDFTIDENAILGEGAFGVVLKGVINKDKLVAAKTIRRNAEVVYVKSLLSELKVMIYIKKHVNIIGLVGAFTKNLKSGLVYVFYELCPLGSLEKYLRENRMNFIEAENQIQYENIFKNDYENVSNNTVNFLDLLNWSYQIANGMEYLCKKKVIHGDLATRNILLMEKNLIKITDFGLSRRLYEYTNYVKKSQEPLPWRWMAIESLRELKFSSESDVWSFGVTLWEIFSMGDIPYAGLSWSVNFTAQLLDYSVRLPKPTYGTTEIYDILMECWKCNPLERPSFERHKQSLLDSLQIFSNNTYSSQFFTFAPKAANSEAPQYTALVDIDTGSHKS